MRDFICISCWTAFTAGDAEIGPDGHVKCPHCGYLQDANAARSSKGAGIGMPTDLTLGSAVGPLPTRPRTASMLEEADQTTQMPMSAEVLAIALKEAETGRRRRAATSTHTRPTSSSHVTTATKTKPQWAQSAEAAGVDLGSLDISRASDDAATRPTPPPTAAVAAAARPAAPPKPAPAPEPPKTNPLEELEALHPEIDLALDEAPATAPMEGLPEVTAMGGDAGRPTASGDAGAGSRDREWTLKTPTGLKLQFPDLQLLIDYATGQPHADMALARAGGPFKPYAAFHAELTPRRDPQDVFDGVRDTVGATVSIGIGSSAPDDDAPLAGVGDDPFGAGFDLGGSSDWAQEGKRTVDTAPFGARIQDLGQLEPAPDDRSQPQMLSPDTAVVEPPAPTSAQPLVAAQATAQRAAISRPVRAATSSPSNTQPAAGVGLSEQLEGGPAPQPLLREEFSFRTGDAPRSPWLGRVVSFVLGAAAAGGVVYYLAWLRALPGLQY